MQWQMPFLESNDSSKPNNLRTQGRPRPSCARVRMRIAQEHGVGLQRRLACECLLFPNVGTLHPHCMASIGAKPAPIKLACPRSMSEADMCPKYRQYSQTELFLFNHVTITGIPETTPHDTGCARGQKPDATLMHRPHHCPCCVLPAHGHTSRMACIHYVRSIVFVHTLRLNRPLSCSTTYTTLRMYR